VSGDLVSARSKCERGRVRFVWRSTTRLPEMSYVKGRPVLVWKVRPARPLMVLQVLDASLMRISVLF
jgi:hypothetical protein